MLATAAKCTNANDVLFNEKDYYYFINLCHPFIYGNFLSRVVVYGYICSLKIFNSDINLGHRMPIQNNLVH